MFRYLSYIWIFFLFVFISHGATCTSGTGEIWSPGNGQMVVRCSLSSVCPDPTLCDSAGEVGTTVVCSRSGLPDTSFTCEAQGANPHWSRPAVCTGSNIDCSGFLGGIYNNAASFGTLVSLSSCNSGSGGICPSPGCCNALSHSGSVVSCATTNSGGTPYRQLFGCAVASESPYFRQLCSNFCGSTIGSIGGSVQCSVGGNCPAQGCCADSSQNGQTISCVNGAGATLTYVCRTGGNTPIFDPRPVVASCPTPTIGSAGVLYTGTLTATGGTGPYTYTKNGGPAWLTVSASSLRGTPPAAGSYTFTITATDSIGATATSSQCTITVTGAPSITCNAALPDGEFSVAYPSTQVATASGGTNSFTYTSTITPTGSGLSVNSAGQISGTPAVTGQISVAITATDTSGGTATRTCTFNVVPGPSPACPPGSPFTTISGVNFQTPAITVTQGSGTGYAIQSVTEVSRSPTNAPASSYSFSGLTVTSPTTAGFASVSAQTTYTYRITVRDSRGGTGTVNCQVIVNPPIAISCPPTTVINRNVALSSTPTITGGAGAGSYVVVFASGGASLTLDSATGRISAAANSLALGTITYTLRVTSTTSSGYSASATTSSCSLQVIAAPSVACPSSFPYTGEVGLNFPNSPSVYTGTPGSFAIVSGSLPNPLTIDSNGIIRGNAPTAAGVYNFAIRFTDRAGTVATSATCQITIIAGPSFTCSGIASQTRNGRSYTGQPTISGGVTPYVVSISNLPSGLSVTNTATGAFGGTLAANACSTSPCGSCPCTLNLAITVRDANGVTVTNPTCPLTIYANADFTCPSGTFTIGSTFSAVLAESSSTCRPATFSLSANPSWMTLTSKTLGGTVAGPAGTQSFTVAVTDCFGTQVSKTCSITVTAVPVISQTCNYPNTCAGAAYSRAPPTVTNVGSGGGSNPYSITWGSSGPITGMSFSTSTGTISAGAGATAAAASGTYGFTITYTDTQGARATVTCSITVAVVAATCPARTNQYGTGTLITGADVGQLFRVVLPACPTCVYSNLQVPAGLTWLSLSSAGVLQGTPTASNTCGTGTSVTCSFSYTYTLTDSSSGCSSTITCSLNVYPSTVTQACPTSGLTVLASSTTQRYITFPAPVGGSPPYTYTLTFTPAIPAADIQSVFSSSTGWLQQYRVIFRNVGTYQMCGTVTDAYGRTTNFCCTVIVRGPLDFTCPPNQPTCVSPFNYNFTANLNGQQSGPVTWSIRSTNPSGAITLNSVTGIATVSSVPNTAATYSFQVRASDSTQTTSWKTCTFNFVAAADFTCPTLNVQTNVAIAGTPTISNANCPTCTFSGSQQGISVSSGGVFSGTFTGSSNTNIQVTRTNPATGACLVKSCLMTRYAGPSITCPSLIYASKTVAWSATATPTTSYPGGVASLTITGLPGATVTTAGVISLSAAAVNALTTGTTYQYTLRVTDAGGAFATTTCPVTIYDFPTVNCPTPTTGAVSVLYSGSISGTGAPTLVFSRESGTYPPGLNNLPTNGGSFTFTPTTAGAYTFVVRLTDGAGSVVSRSCTITISNVPLGSCPAISGNALYAIIGNTFSASLQGVSCTPGPCSVTATGLPNNIVISTAGVLGLSGATVNGPATSQVNYAVTIRDTTSNAVSTFNCPIRVIGGLTAQCPANSQVNSNQVYNEQVQITAAGASPYTYQLQSSNLPAGVVLTSQGFISGTVTGVTSQTTYTYRVLVTDNAAQTSQTAVCNLIVSPRLVLTCPSTQSISRGANYAATGVATGGRTPYTYALVTGPTGWSSFAVSSAGAITGNPGTQTGTSSYTFSVTDANGQTVTPGSACQVIVNTVLSVACPTNPVSTDVGIAYSGNAVGTGGFTASYVYSQTGLPAALTLNTASGLISGTFGAVATGSFTISLTDGVSNAGPVTCPYTVVPQPTPLTCPTWVNSEVGLSAPNSAAAGFTIPAGSGTGTLTYSVTLGLSALQTAGLTFSSSTGRWSGTLVGSGGTFTYAGRVVDAVGASSNSLNCTLTVLPPPTPICPSASANTGSFYNSLLTATGGSGGYVFTITAGALPEGIRFTAPNVVSGPPAYQGLSSFTVRVTDSNGVFTQVVCQILVAAPGCVDQNQNVTLSNSGAQCNAGGSVPYGCGTCSRVSNPCFSRQCQLNAVLILDSSASIAYASDGKDYRVAVRNGVLAFINGISQIVNVGGSASLGLIEFSDAAVLRQDLQPITSTYLNTLTNYVQNTYLYSNLGQTNWADPLHLARSTAWGTTPAGGGVQKPIDIFVMFTDGMPEAVVSGLRWNCEDNCYSETNAFFSNLCSPAGTCSGPPSQPAGLTFPPNIGARRGLWAACTAADALKKTGAKLFLVGVGDVLTNEDEIQVITGRIKWDSQPTTFFTSDYIISASYNDLADLLKNVVQGLCPCFSSYPSCVPSTAYPSSCNAQLFSARVRVTTRDSAGVTFPDYSIMSANIYYSFLGGSSARVQFEYFNPTFPVTTPEPATIVRTDTVNPCQLQRVVSCGNKCLLFQETQNIPRFFLEDADSPVVTGNIYPGPPGCKGYTKVYPYPTFPVNLGLSSPETIKYLWVRTSDNITPCAAEAFDGTFYEFFDNTAPVGTVRGVNQLGSAPRKLPALSPAVDFTTPPTCTSSRNCANPAEYVFVIDEQETLTTTDNLNMKSYILSLANALNGNSTFGWMWSNPAGGIQGNGFDILTLNAMSNAMINSHANYGGFTDFAAAVTRAVNQYWPGATSPSGLPRKLVILVGGPDRVNTLGTDPTGSRWTTLTNLLNSKGIERWAIGVDVGSSDASLLTKMASTNNYLHVSQFQLASDLMSVSLPDMTTRLCPQGSVCGSTCRGFCNCDDVCVCPNCVQDACSNTRICSTASAGCQAPPIVCNDGNLCNAQRCDLTLGCQHPRIVFCNDNLNCTQDSCLPQSGECSFVPTNCDPGDKCRIGSCVESTGLCQSTPAPPCEDNNVCTENLCSSLSGCYFPDITASLCRDANQCWSASCDPILGCSYASTASRCITGDKCKIEGCVNATGCSSSVVNCNDNSVCTVDTCSSATGCIFTDNSRQLCEKGWKCMNFTCHATQGCLYNDISSTCDDGNACTIDSCDNVTGCSNVLKNCDDNNQCTDDSCVDGVCQNDFNPNICAACGVEPLCAASLTFNACQLPLCIDVSTIQTGNLTCSDPRVTNTALCNQEVFLGNPPRHCFVADKPPCDDGNACTVDRCDPVRGCVSDPLVCDDGNACTQNLCDRVTGCYYSTPVTCDDNSLCTTDSCNITTGCSFKPITCNSGMGACSVDTCDPQIGCVYNPVTCVGNACQNKTCDFVRGCHLDTLPCDDNNKCSTSSCDPVLGCRHIFDVTCSDGLRCTNDRCDPLLGCLYEPVQCQAPTFCSTFSCSESTGACGPVPVNCDDRNNCTTDSCSESLGGCQNVPVQCFTTSQCQIWSCYPDGSCRLNGTRVCNDLNSCTSDSCSDTQGCLYRNIICPPGRTECEYAFDCNGTFAFPECKYQNISQLIDICGLCLGDNTECIFSSLLSPGEITAITAGAVAGIVIGCVIAALIAAYLSKRGYDYYKAQSDMNAANTLQNPYYVSNGLSGDVPL